MKPLDGIRVVDLSRVLAGPYCSLLLADMGAEVIKVEEPGHGDDTRTWGPPWVEQDAAYYLGLNRNKRSLTLDLADPGDAALARRLAERADVLVESFRPGTIDRLGLGYETLKAVNPRIIFAEVSAFGQTGPDASQLASCAFWPGSRSSWPGARWSFGRRSPWSTCAC